MRMLRIGDGVVFLHNAYANIVVLRDGEDVTLVDSGYPRDVEELVQALEHLGVGPNNIVAGLLTHGHTDHQGGFARLRSRGWAFPIYAAAEEIPNIRREAPEQITVKSAGWAMARPRVARWAIGAIRRGGFDDVAIAEDVHALPGHGELLDLPGRPKVIRSDGHTSGHTAFGVAQGEVLLTGDALVTGHHTLSLERPRARQLPAIFHHDEAHAAHSADYLQSLGARVIVPGHGLPYKTR